MGMNPANRLTTIRLAPLRFTVASATLPTVMNFETVLDRLSGESGKQGGGLLLVGGWALNAYGVSRQTLDIDFVCMPDALASLDSLLVSCGYSRVYRDEIFAKYRSPTDGLLDVDLLFVDKDTVGALLAESRVLEIGKAKFPVPSLNHLIAMKLHALKHNAPRRGAKDTADIVALIEANQLDVRNPEFHALCLKFGDQDLYEQLLSEPGA